MNLVLNNLTVVGTFSRIYNLNLRLNPYDVGTYKNFVQVFGSNPLIWLLPIKIQKYEVGNGFLW